MAIRVSDLSDYRHYNPMPAPMDECMFTHEQLRDMHYYDAVGDFLLRHVAEQPEDTCMDVVVELGYDHAVSGLRTVFERYGIINIDEVQAVVD